MYNHDVKIRKTEMVLGVVICNCYFFFFKQKTAYEMRISDWSSDVCSSDLRVGERRGTPARHRLLRGSREARARAPRPGRSRPHPRAHRVDAHRGEPRRPRLHRRPARSGRATGDRRLRNRLLVAVVPEALPGRHRERSEEHTSELQSLMRISYAVFCLQKKTHT